MNCFASPTECWPKWKIEAASTAVAWPSRMPSTRCSSVPTPPDAITGTGTASAMARVSTISKPGLVASAMGEDIPTQGLAGLRHSLGVDRDHDALVAELLRRLLHKCTPRNR